MSVTAVPPRSLPEPPDTGIRPRRWTRKEYYRAAELGLFRPEERLELLDGEIIQKMAPGGPHAAVVSRSSRILAEAFGPGHHIRAQQPLTLNNWSEPEPDGVVALGTEFDYLPDHPKASDARLVVEVSDTTLRFDRSRKQAAYARARVLEYWIINLPHRQLEVYRKPSGSRYRSVTIYREGEAVAPLGAPGASIHVSDLLPPASVTVPGE
jgi:Uma2 family endonuclease